MEEAHAGIARGHYGRCDTTRKVLHAGLWWPTLHNDATGYARSYDVCQRIGKPLWQDEMPLVPEVTLKPFDKWVVDFVGPIHPPRKRTGAHYIIAVMDYLMRWTEAALVVDCTAAMAGRFLFENIVTQFGCSRILMSDHGSHFINRTVRALTE